MAWRIVGRLVVAVHSQSSPTKVEWQRFLSDASRAGVDGRFRLLVVSHGGGPDGRQRKELTDAIHKSGTPRMAMLTDSKVVRALMFAFSFINRSTKVFGLSDDRQAFEFLELDAPERAEARSLRRALEAEAGVNANAVAGSVG